MPNATTQPVQIRQMLITLPLKKDGEVLNIDPIEHCNFKCYFCGAKNLTSRTYMDFDVYVRVVDEAIDIGFTALMLTPALGEAFLHPRIYDMLEYALKRFKRVELVSNGSAIDVARLAAIDTQRLQLQISQYGRTSDEFTELTGMPGKMFTSFLDKLKELNAAGVSYGVYMRDREYKFNLESDAPQLHDINSKCHHHFIQKIFPNGDVTFCRFISDGVDAVSASAVTIANVSHKPLREILTDPIRFKFYDSQTICAATCSHSTAPCGKATLNAYKLMANSKQKYHNNQQTTDHQYENLEHICLQLDQSQTGR